MKTTIEMIEEAKKGSPNPIVAELIQHFEDFAGRVSQLPSQKEKGLDEAFVQKLNDTRDRLRSSFSRVAASFGMTFDQFCAYVDNPQNFAPEKWAEIEEARNQILGHFETRKKTKLNKNIKG